MKNSLEKDLKELIDEKQAKILSGFFKTGKGQYGEGDIFLGIKVPRVREVAKKYIDMDLSDIEKLLQSKTHEVRFAALTILIQQFEKGNNVKREEIYNLYLKNIAKNINNWDLVDLSCPQIIGRYVFEKKNSDILYVLAKSSNLWEKRVAMIATYYAIKREYFCDALNIAEILLYDKHDLINKAVGWMLREVGKRNMKDEKDFLEKYYKTMPRVALRYAIEKMDQKERNYFLGKK